MNYYQKAVLLVTLFIIALTGIFFYLVKPTDISDLLSAEMGMIVFAELMLGLLMLRAFINRASTVFSAIASSMAGLGYLVFVVFMLVLVPFDIELSTFMLIHLMGFIVCCIGYAFMSFAPQHMKEVEEEDAKCTPSVGLHERMFSIHQMIQADLYEETELLQASQTLQEELRYALDEKLKANDTARKVMSLLDCLEGCIQTKDVDDALKQIKRITIMIS